VPLISVVGDRGLPLLNNPGSGIYDYIGHEESNGRIGFSRFVPPMAYFKKEPIFGGFRGSDSIMRHKWCAAVWRSTLDTQRYLRNSRLAARKGLWVEKRLNAVPSRFGRVVPWRGWSGVWGSGHVAITLKNTGAHLWSDIYDQSRRYEM